MHVRDQPDNTGEVSHGHSHGAVDGEILTSDRGIWATNISLAAFTLSRKLPNKRFNYGYGRAEDLAGLLIVVSILATGIYVGYESITRLSDPPEIDYIWVVAAAAIIGFIGNEAVALFRMKIGKEVGSAALVADGHHARVDGLTSLAVLFGAVGVWVGIPLADPIVGLVISAAILRIVVETSKSVFSRLLDGVEPEVPDEVRNVALVTGGVRGVAEVQVRWLGHKMLAEVNIAEDGHHQLLHNLKYLSNATVHVDPVGLAGEEYHRHGIGNTEHQESHVDEHEEHGHSHD